MAHQARRMFRPWVALACFGPAAGLIAGSKFERDAAARDKVRLLTTLPDRNWPGARIIVGPERRIASVVDIRPPPRNDDDNDGNDVTVVLHAGAADTAFAWSRVLPRLASSSGGAGAGVLDTPFDGRTRIVAYSRAGMGFSEEADAQVAGSPRDAAALAAELDETLDALGVSGPIVHVAHGAGALTARVHAARTATATAGGSGGAGAGAGADGGRRAVAGMVLLDPVCEGVREVHEELSPQVASMLTQQQRVNWVFARLADIGVVRLLVRRKAQIDQFLREYAPDTVRFVQAAGALPRQRRTIHAEQAAMARSERQAHATTAAGGAGGPLLPAGAPALVVSAVGTFADMGGRLPPVTVEKMQRVWQAAQRNLAMGLSDASAHFVAKSKPAADDAEDEEGGGGSGPSGHKMPHMQPGLVADAIKATVLVARGNLAGPARGRRRRGHDATTTLSPRMRGFVNAVSRS